MQQDPKGMIGLQLEWFKSKIYIFLIKNPKKVRIRDGNIIHLSVGNEKEIYFLQQ